jgi:hypothetical protein
MAGLGDRQALDESAKKRRGLRLGPADKTRRQGVQAQERLDERLDLLVRE